MGYTLNAYGKPVFDDVYSFPGDSQANADFAHAFAWTRGGTASDRDGLLPGQLRVGLRFDESDTGRSFIYRGAGNWQDVTVDALTVSSVTSLAIVTSGTNKPLTFVGAAPDVRGGGISLNLATGVVTVATEGLYAFDVMVTWSAGGTSTPRFLIMVGAADRRSIQTSNGVVTCTLSTVVRLTAGQSVELLLYQASGSTLNVGAEGGAPNTLSVYRLGA